MKNKLTLFSNWIIYIVICLVMYFWENVAILDFQTPIREFTMNEIIAFFLGIILITTIFFIIEKKHNRFKFDWFLIIVLSLLFLCSAMVALFAPEYREFAILSRGFLNGEAPEREWLYGFFYVSGFDRVFSIMFAFLNYLMIYLFLGVFPRKFRFQRIVNIGVYIALAVTVVAMVYSYITEFDKYIGIIRSFAEEGPLFVPTVQAFFLNRNNYGFLLYLVIFGILYVHHNHPKWWWCYPIAWFCFINMLFTISKASIALSFFMLIAYPIGRFFITLKERRMKNAIAMIATLSSVLLVTGTISVIFFFNDQLREVFIHTLKMILITEEGVHVNTVTTRVWLWENTIDILNNSSWVFGAGFWIYPELLLTYNLRDTSTNHNRTSYAHNYFFQILGEGGLIYLAFILFTLVLYFICLVKLAKRHRTFVFLQFLFISTMGVHMMLGSSGPIAHSLPSVDGVLVTALSYLPVFSTYYHEKHPEDNKEFLKEADKRIKTRKKYFNNPFSISDIIYFIYTPILAIIIGPVWMALKNYALGMVIPGIIFFFIGPYLIQLIHNSFKEKTKKYNNFWKYLLNIQLPFLVGLVIMVAFERIFLLLTSVTFMMCLLVSFSAILLYGLFFILIPKFNERAEFLTVLDYNYTNIAMRLYRPFVREVVEKTESGACYG